MTDQSRTDEPIAHGGSPTPTMLDLVGLWECGSCGEITDVAHFYEDRQSGVVGHEADPEKRAKKASRCGWSYGYGYVGNDSPIRCALAHDHYGPHDPKLHGYGRFTEDWDAVRPYDPRNGASHG